MSTRSTKAPEALRVVVQISYCPELGIYHYVRSDGSEYFFDNAKLEESLVVYISQKMMADAHHMNGLARAARSHPHQILVYDKVDEPPKIVDPKPLYSFADLPDDPPVGGKLGKSGKRS